MKLARILVLFVAVCAAIAAVCALGGALFALFHGGTSYASGIGWAMAIGGSLLVLVAGGSGSTTRMAGESRIVVGGRFVQGSDIPQPQSPFVLIPAGLVVLALGIAISLAG